MKINLISYKSYIFRTWEINANFVLEPTSRILYLQRKFPRLRNNVNINICQAIYSFQRAFSLIMSEN